MEIRRSYDRLISIMGFPIPVRRHILNQGPDRVITVPHSDIYRVRRA